MKKTAESEALEFLDKINAELAAAAKQAVSEFEQTISHGVGVGFEGYFRARKMRVAEAARREFLSWNRSEIADACLRLIAAKTEHRAAWRNQVGDKIGKIVRAQALGDLNRGESERLERELMALETALENRDAEFSSAQDAVREFLDERSSSMIEQRFSQAVTQARELPFFEPPLALSRAA
jgi:hypothetical protein